MIKVFNDGELQAYIDEIEPNITEEVNGEFTFDFTAIIDQEKSQYINYNSLFEVEGQLFQVALLAKERDQDGLYIYVNGEQVSYQLIDDELESFSSNGTPSEIMSDLFAGTSFTVGEVDFTDPLTVSIKERTNKRQVLMNLAAAVGGELSFDQYEISLLSRRGSENGIHFRVGKNLMGVKKSVDGREKDAQGNPKSSYEIDLIELSGLEEYEDVKDLEVIRLGDTVRVKDDDLGIDVQTRLLKYSYNPKQKINSSVELSNVTKNLSDDLVVLQQKSVMKDEVYNGVKVGPEVGFQATRSDDKVRTTVNATEGFEIAKGDGNGSYAPVISFDTEGNARFKGLVEASDFVGGTIDIGSGTFTVDNQGNMVATSGSFEGDIDASNISGSSFVGGSINIGNSTFTVDNNGNMVANSGEFKGKILIEYGGSYLDIDNISGPDGVVPMARFNDGTSETMVFQHNGKFKIHSDGDVEILSKNGVVSAESAFYANQGIQIYGNAWVGSSQIATESWVQNMINDAIADHESTYHSGS